MLLEYRYGNYNDSRLAKRYNSARDFRTAFTQMIGKNFYLLERAAEICSQIPETDPKEGIAVSEGQAARAEQLIQACSEKLNNFRSGEGELNSIVWRQAFALLERAAKQLDQSS